MKTAILAGIDSGLGILINKHFRSTDWKVVGTTRRLDAIGDTENGTDKYYCDFSLPASIDECTSRILNDYPNWQVLILSIGQLNPIGLMNTLNSDDWDSSFYVNFTGQNRFIKNMIGLSQNNSNRMVLTFAGSGTNSAPEFYSCYTLAKISLIKAMELYAVENPDCKFVSVGTGWMNTPIHEQTLRAGSAAGANFEITKKRIQQSDFGETQLLLDFIDWCLVEDNKVVSGRNFALQNDDWGKQILRKELLSNKDFFKLRRKSFENQGQING